MDLDLDLDVYRSQQGHVRWCFCRLRRRHFPFQQLRPPSTTLPQALEREAAGCEAHTVAAGLETAGARGHVQRLELEVERLHATNDVLAMQVDGGDTY